MKFSEKGAGGSKAVRKFSGNSSVFGETGFPKAGSIIPPENGFRANRDILGHVGPFWAILMILGNFRLFWCCFESHWGPRGYQKGPGVGQ